MQLVGMWARGASTWAQLVGLWAQLVDPWTQLCIHLMFAKASTYKVPPVFLSTKLFTVRVFFATVSFVFWIVCMVISQAEHFFWQA